MQARRISPAPDSPALHSVPSVSDRPAAAAALGADRCVLLCEPLSVPGRSLLRRTLLRPRDRPAHRHPVPHRPALRRRTRPPVKTTCARRRRGATVPPDDLRIGPTMPVVADRDVIRSVPPPRDRVAGLKNRSESCDRVYPSSPTSSTVRNAFCGISTSPNCFSRFLPSFCLAHSLRLRVISPP